MNVKGWIIEVTDGIYGVCNNERHRTNEKKKAACGWIKRTIKYCILTSTENVQLARDLSNYSRQIWNDARTRVK